MEGGDHMITITKQQVLQLARMSAIEVTEEEIPQLITDLQAVLAYAQRVSKVTQGVSASVDVRVNVMRPDEVVATDPEPLLAGAPEREQNLFVVPRILDIG